EARRTGLIQRTQIMPGDSGIPLSPGIFVSGGTVHVLTGSCAKSDPIHREITVRGGIMMETQSCVVGIERMRHGHPPASPRNRSGPTGQAGLPFLACPPRSVGRGGHPDAQWG